MSSLPELELLTWKSHEGSSSAFTLLRGSAPVGALRWTEASSAAGAVLGREMVAVTGPFRLLVTLSEAETGRVIAHSIRAPLTWSWRTSINGEPYWWRRDPTVEGYSFWRKGERLLSLSFRTGMVSTAMERSDRRLTALVALGCVLATAVAAAPWWVRADIEPRAFRPGGPAF